MTVGERILLHLADHPTRDPYTAPSEVTQRGLALASGIQRRHVPQYVRPLMAKALVEEHVVHVQGGRQRMKAYALTAGGRTEASRLRARFQSMMVDVEAPDGGRKPMALGEAAKGAFKGVALLDLLRRIEEEGCLRQASVGPPSSLPRSPVFVDMTSAAPRLDLFLGREDELREITRENRGPRVYVVRGVAGIGKTSLAARACEILRGHRNLLWHRVRPWDTRQSILADLGAFLGALGKPGLRSLLGRGDIHGAVEALREDLRDSRSFLVLDDAHEASGEVVALLGFLREAVGEAPDVKLLVLTRRTLPFYDRRDVVLRHLVMEVELSGLEPQEVADFLPFPGGPPGIPRPLGGHPLSLQLLRASPTSGVAEARRNLRRFMEETIYAELSDGERRMMKVASLYRVAVPREALLIDATCSPEVLISLANRSLLVTVGDDALEVHDTIRDFFSSLLSPAERSKLRPIAFSWLRRLAADAQARGDLMAAMNYRANAIPLAKKGADASGAWEDLGDALGRLGDVPGELDAYHEALQATEDPVAAARLLRKTAAAHVAREELMRALAELDEAARCLGVAEDPEQGLIQLVRCQTYTELERGSEARECGMKALDIFQRLGNTSTQARALLILGKVEINLLEGQPRVAKGHFVAALELAQRMGDWPLEAEVHVALAHLFAYRFGDARGAVEHIAAVEARPETLEDLEMRRSFLMLKAWFTLEMMADPQGAAAHFTEAMEVARKIHHKPTLLVTPFGLACVAYFQGHLEEAEAAFQRCAEVASTRETPGFVAEALWMEAECCLLQGDLKGFRHVAAAFEAPEMAREIESRIVLATVLRALERLIEGDWEGCRTTFAEAFHYAEERFAPQEWHLGHFVHFFYGVALRAAGEDGEAEVHLRRARELLAASGLKARLSLFADHERRLVEILGRALRAA